MTEVASGDADPIDLSFLAPPGQVSDWRLALLFDAACQVGLVEALADGPADHLDLASRLGLDAHAVRVVLEALTSWSVLRRADNESFALGSAWPSRASTAALRHHASALRAWSSGIEDRLRGIGSPGRRPRPPELELWLEALAVRARQCAPGVADACLARVPNAASVLELGGGHGEYGLELARRGLTVTMQDRPEVVETVGDRLRAQGIDLFAGDFFETLPPGPFDLVLCSGINHTYDAQHNRQLCERAGAVTKGGGALAIVTYLRGRDAMAPIFAVQMLLGASEARVHVEEDFRRWLDAAGYGNVELIDAAHPRETLIVARRFAHGRIATRRAPSQ